MDYHDRLFAIRSDLETRWASPENIRGEKGRDARWSISIDRSSDSIDFTSRIRSSSARTSG